MIVIDNANTADTISGHSSSRSSSSSSSSNSSSSSSSSSSSTLEGERGNADSTKPRSRVKPN